MTAKAPGKTNVARAVTYKVHYRYPWCFDDGGMYHDENWSDSSRVIEAKNDREAQLASLANEFHGKEHCYHGRSAYPVRIEKTVRERNAESWERTTVTDIPLPRRKKCPCGKDYWPIHGEKPCHKLRTAR